MEYNYVSYEDIPLIMTVEDLMPILLIGAILPTIWSAAVKSRASGLDGRFGFPEMR